MVQKETPPGRRGCCVRWKFGIRLADGEEFVEVAMGHSKTFFETHSDNLLEVGFAVKSDVDGDGGPGVGRLEPYLPVHFWKCVGRVAILVGEGDGCDKAFLRVDVPKIYATRGGGFVVGTNHGIEPDAAGLKIHAFCLCPPWFGRPPFVEKAAVCPGLPDRSDGGVEGAGDKQLFA